MPWCMSVGILNLQNTEEKFCSSPEVSKPTKWAFWHFFTTFQLGIWSASTVLEFNAELSCDTWKQHYYFTSNRGKLSNTTKLKLTKQIGIRSCFWIPSPCLNHKIMHYSSAPITSELHTLMSKHQKRFCQSLNYFQAWQEDSGLEMHKALLSSWENSKHT